MLRENSKQKMKDRFLLVILARRWTFHLTTFTIKASFCLTLTELIVNETIRTLSINLLSGFCT